MPRRTPRFVAALVLAGAAALPGVAEAQSVNLSQAGFRFLREVRRPDGQLPNWISRRDCLEDNPVFGEDPDLQRATIQMSPNVTGATTGWSLQVWAGSGVDCTDVNQRQGAVARCWEVGRANNPRLAVVTIDVSPRKVAGGRDTMDVPPDEIGEEVCEQQIQLPITFYLMLVDGGGNIQGSVATWENTTLDLLGPPAPTALTAGIAENALVASWTVPIEGDLDDIDGFALYCDEAGGVPPGGMGGMTGAAGAAGSPGGGACTSANLVAGELPNLDFQCGRSGGRGTRDARTETLQNGTNYAIAVAGVDRVGNSGPLSPLACGTPQPVTTFFEAYREAGGRGGGGFCSWAPPTPLGSGAVGSLLGAGLWWLRRRRGRA